MSTHLITNWIHGPRLYSYGVLLYNRLGTDNDLKQLFATGNTPYTQKKLLAAMKALTTATDVKENLVKTDPAAIMPDATNQVLQQLKTEWMPKFTQMHYLRHQLDKYLSHTSAAAHKKRGLIAKDILLLEKQCMAIWARRDHYIKFGHLPPVMEKPEKIIDPSKLGLRYTTVQTYIRRIKGQLKMQPVPDPAKVERLRMYQNEFEDIKKQLNK